MFLSYSGLVFGQTHYELDYSSYFGGTSWEHARDIVTDANGYTYVVGGTGSSNFAGSGNLTPNVYNAGQPNSAADANFGGCDAFISKLDPNGQLLWSRYMGGQNYDRAYAVEIAPNGSLYISGRAGIGFPTTNGFQTTHSGVNSPSSYGNQNAFVANLDTNGNLLWSSYLGTGTLARDIAVDPNGDLYVPLVLDAGSSRTLSSAFTGKFTNSPPTTNTQDVGVVKLAGDGSGVKWARWLGGTGSDITNPSIRVNSAGEAHLLFDTTSKSTTGLAAVGTGVQTNNGGGQDSYVAKFKSDGSGLVYGTYVGGSTLEQHETHSLALDASGNAVVALRTTSANFPVTPGTVGTVRDDTAAVGVVLLDANGARVSSTMVGGTVLGGNGDWNPDGVYVGPDGKIYVSFETSSTNLPVTSDAFQSTSETGGHDDGGFFVLSSDLTNIDYMTYFRGALGDNSRALYLGQDGSVYLAGGTLSTDFPTLNAFDSTFNGGSHPNAPNSGDAWVAKFSMVPEPSLTFLMAIAAFGLVSKRHRREWT